MLRFWFERMSGAGTTSPDPGLERCCDGLGETRRALPLLDIIMYSKPDGGVKGGKNKRR